MRGVRNRPREELPLPADQKFSPGNLALSHKEYDSSLPYIMNVGMEFLRNAMEEVDPGDYPASHIRDFYAENQPEVVETQGEALDTVLAKRRKIVTRSFRK